MFDSQKLSFEKFLLSYRHGIYIFTDDACHICQDYKQSIEYINNAYLYFVEVSLDSERKILAEMLERTVFPLTACFKDNKLKYAPKMFKENGLVIVPKSDDDSFFFERGYYKVIDNKPHFDAINQYIEILKWNIDETFHILTSVYVVREKENTNIKSNHVKRYSKLKITLFCIEMGIWNSVKEYLEKIGYYDLFVMATFFLESDEYFNKGL
jgi:hypothetical protein